MKFRHHLRDLPRCSTKGRNRFGTGTRITGPLINRHFSRPTSKISPNKGTNTKRTRVSVVSQSGSVYVTFEDLRRHHRNNRLTNFSSDHDIELESERAR